MPDQHEANYLYLYIVFPVIVINSFKDTTMNVNFETCISPLALFCQEHDALHILLSSKFFPTTRLIIRKKIIGYKFVVLMIVTQEYTYSVAFLIPHTDSDDVL